MPKKISFQLVEEHLRFTHFIEADGSIVSCKTMEELEEVRVGIVNKYEFPSQDQRLSMCELGRMATHIDPTITMEFGEACSPFLAIYETRNPITHKCG
ncbi:MAG: hypothetical protein EOP84_32690 [Verrucomicrobiaceae bacterium]|nr:MAG: hypothetical protein EOP84_32690 [Verrucomicrobiaceae bacterium]